MFGPALMALTPVIGTCVGVGVDPETEVEPSCPEALPPQQYTIPDPPSACPVSAQVWTAPAVIAVAGSVNAEATGESTAMVAVTPSCPEPLSPQQ
jgi:hypothetical protein